MAVNKIRKQDTTHDIHDARVPELPADASEKTYVLKAVNGTVAWVEEVEDVETVEETANGDE